MKNKIFVTRKIPIVGTLSLTQAGYNVVISDKDYPLTKKELIKVFKKDSYSGVVSLLTDEIDAEVLACMKDVKVISNYAVGFNNIDIKTAKEKNISVCNTKASSGDIVAEHTMALLYALTSRVVWGDFFVKKGKYNGWDPMLLRGSSLRGKTVGIIGAGDIGKHFARMCRNGHGMQVVYFDIKRDENLEKELNAVYIRTVDELVSISDVVSLHVPLNEHTFHLIDKKRLGMMKRDGILLNTARGPIIDEQALVRSLEKNEIAGAGLDVFEFEPKLSKGLTKLPNVVLTPHIASATKENREQMSIIACKNIMDILENGKCDNLVN